MKWTRIALAVIAMLQSTVGVASAQRTRFLRVEEFDRTCLRTGTFVEVSYYRDGDREAKTKGYVSAVHESALTVENAIGKRRIPFRDVGILVVGRGKPKIYVFRNRPAPAADGHARVSAPPPHQLRPRTPT